MGKALILSNCDFSAHNIGKVTFSENIPVVSISILGLNSVTGNTEATTYSIEYLPSSTTQRGITWSIISGSTYASISSDGILTIKSNADNNSITIKAQSTDNPNIYSTKDVTVSYESPFEVPDFKIVGTNEPNGDIRAGVYYLLDTTNMKQIVGSMGEVTDDYKEYVGAIEWSITDGNSYGSLTSTSASTAELNVTNTGSITISASIANKEDSITVSATYDITDYIITSFADLEALESAVNNGTESSITIPLAQGSSYVPTTGFAGAHFRLASDIDCGNDHVEIGKYNASKSVNKYFAGIFDGAGYKLYNLGGAAGVNGTAAEGGYVGSILCGNLNGGTIRNLELYGAVTTSGSRGFGGVCAFGVGNCKLENIYNACDYQYSGTSAATMEIMLGWDGSSTANTTFNDCIYAGKAINIRQIPGYTAVYSNITRCSNIGKLIVEYGQVTGYTSLAGVGDTANSPKAYLNSCYQIMGMEGINKGTSSSAGNRMIGGNITDSYEATICIGSMESGICSMGTNTRTYTQNSWQNGTAKTESEIKNSITFETENNWIQIAGYYPINNNQWAVKSLVLDRAKNGYVEAEA